MSILQIYSGALAPQDFAFNSTSWLASNFPSNPTFTKLSDTSVLDVRANCDFTSSNTIPNAIFMGLFVDGHLAQASAYTQALPNYFTTISWAVLKSGLLAGEHAFRIHVALANGTSNAVLRSSTSCDLSITEFEPAADAGAVDLTSLTNRVAQIEGRLAAASDALAAA